MIAVAGLGNCSSGDAGEDVGGLEVDYVRVYQKTMDVGMSQIGHDLCPTDGGC
jgi:hypothetical protein